MSEKFSSGTIHSIRIPNSLRKFEIYLNVKLFIYQFEIGLESALRIVKENKINMEKMVSLL